MTQITPMKQLKGNIEIFKNETKDLFNFLPLNRAEPKYNPLHQKDSKGVDCDFILLMNPINKEKKNSFSGAFVFTYLDETKPATVKAQVKTGPENDSIISSVEMSLEEFRKSINAVNKAIKASNSNGNIGMHELFKLLTSTFEIVNKPVENTNSKEMNELEHIAGISSLAPKPVIKTRTNKI